VENFLEILKAKYAEKYAEFGKICSAYMLHICGIFFRIFPPYANSSDGES